MFLVEKRKPAQGDEAGQDAEVLIVMATACGCGWGKSGAGTGWEKITQPGLHAQYKVELDSAAGMTNI